MHPSSFPPPRNPLSLLRSSTSGPNLIFQLDSTLPTLPVRPNRRPLIRASTSSELSCSKPEIQELGSGDEGERATTGSEQSTTEEDESNPFSSLVEDLEKSTRRDEDELEEVETNEMEMPLNTSIANELDKLLLVPFEPPARSWTRVDQEVSMMDYEVAEEDSPNWSPEAMTFQLRARGEGGGGSRVGTANDKRRISYDVPEYGENSEGRRQDRVTEEGEQPRSEVREETERGSNRWSFEKMFGASNMRRKQEEANRDRSREEGRTRAMKRLKAVEGHLARFL